MPRMRAVQVSRAGGPLEFVEREIPEPGPGLVRIKVQACGICHSDSLVQEGAFPGVEHPRIPGHEVMGVIDIVGPGVNGWATGDRVGVGWNGGYCGYCDFCRRGDYFACRNTTRITGVTCDGGYAEYMLASASALARVPDALSPIEAAPLLCAGVTTFNCLRHCGAQPGDTVGILGLGGLGHLGVQFAAKMGFRTVAIARGADKGPFAKKLGAAEYIDSTAQDVAQSLRSMGGAKAVLATVTNAHAMASIIGGLSPNGTLVIIGAVPTLEVSPLTLLSGRRAVKGWYSGTSIDSQDTLEFCVLTGVRSMNEVYPLSRASEAYERMMKGEARFRAVLSVSE
jgi:D-arabinose 1-dehydrogenase-like Zn-dependent alcohol dehydrogenase